MMKCGNSFEWNKPTRHQAKPWGQVKPDIPNSLAGNFKTLTHSLNWSKCLNPDVKIE